MAAEELAASLLAQLALVGTTTSPEGALHSPMPPSSSYVSLEATDDGRRTRVDVYDENFLMRDSPEQPRGDSHEGGAFAVERQDGFYYLRNIGILISQPGHLQWKFQDLSCRRLDLNGDIHTDSCKRDGTGEQLTNIVSHSRGVLSFTGHCWLTPSRLCTYVLISERGIPSPQR